MIHTAKHAPRESLLAPEQWGGYDIMDDSLFEGVSPLHESLIELTPRELHRVRTDANENLAKITAGNSTEVRFNTGNEFSASTLNDGTIIALEKRFVMRWTGGVHNNPPAADAKPEWQEEFRPVRRPMRSFWLEGQSKKAAGEFARFPRQHCQYTHSLEWGVLLSRGERRLVMQFTASSARLQRDGSVEAGLSHTYARTLPITLGSVTVSGKLHIKGETFIHALEACDAIDVVHAAAGRPEKSRSPSRLAMLAGKLGLSGAPKPAAQQ